jgi:anti-sigma B factor antagonist
MSRLDPPIQGGYFLIASQGRVRGTWLSLDFVALSSVHQGVSGKMAILDPPGEIGGVTPFRAETMHGEGLVVVRLIGELDLTTAPQLGVCLDALRADGARDVRLDLSGLSFCDSSGISAMLTASKDWTKSGGRLSIASPQPAVRRVLEITGLLDWLNAPPSGEHRDGEEP